MVPNWPRSPAHSAELDRRSDVKRHACEQDDSDHPEQLSVASSGVPTSRRNREYGVDRARPGKYLEIADHVRDHEKDQYGAGDRHHDFFADDGVPERDQAIADGNVPDGWVCCVRHKFTDLKRKVGKQESTGSSALV